MCVASLNPGHEFINDCLVITNFSITCFQVPKNLLLFLSISHFTTSRVGKKTKLSPVSFIGTNLWFCIILRIIYTQRYVFDQWNDKCTGFQLIIFQDAFELLQITSTHTQTRNSSRTLSSNFFLFCAKHPLLPTYCNENKNIMWEFKFGVNRSLVIIHFWRRYSLLKILVRVHQMLVFEMQYFWKFQVLLPMDV